MAVVGISGQQQVLAQELSTGEVHKVEKVMGEVRRVARLAPKVEQAHGGRTVAEQDGVGVGIAQVDVGLVVLPPYLAESLIHLGARAVAPAGLIEIRTGQKIVELS